MKMWGKIVEEGEDLMIKRYREIIACGHGELHIVVSKTSGKVKVKREMEEHIE
ncbi:hypothetical protein [Candidatus Magnetobacterium casense]|uniref:Uncharacterized protein n=1 Tax=Candidatus Magnetobacterium casense TaxID=1455061 RepID=A0ABS6S509_9BACT|nr:hypothetical protein [Candidatus Magnetobacterium casensis]MBV6343523.1 hypothetical protein [Candidatus Magnetobacterium casensis]